MIPPIKREMYLLQSHVLHEAKCVDMLFAKYYLEL